MSTLVLAIIGGLSSFASTSLGALVALFSKRKGEETRWSLSIDFALGLMVSASAFTLIGPAALGTYDGHGADAPLFSRSGILAVALLGAIFIYLMKFQIQKLSGSVQKYKTSHLLLASVLMLHNFPEGVASGSAMVGLDLKSALVILGGIAIQNIPEGFLMVVCLKSLGWGVRSSVWGGIASGGVEFVGALLAGLLIHSVTGILPALLSFAGGSMMASVIIEMTEEKGRFWQKVFSKEFALGFFSLLVLQILV